jgi:S-adenosyl methyltransferase
MPFAEPVHEVTQRAAPDDVVFVSYADNHSIVLAHVRALLTGPPGTIGHIDADLNDSGAARPVLVGGGACQVAGELQLAGHE